MPESVIKSGAVVIREATKLDVVKVEKVLLDAYSEFSEVLDDEQWQNYKQSIIEAVHNANTSHRLVAELAGEIVGSVFLFRNGEDAYGNPDIHIESPIVRLLGTSREARGAGIGTALLEASAQLASEEGAHELHLHTSDMMASAVKLYERLGMERVYDKEHMNGDILVKCYKLSLLNNE